MDNNIVLERIKKIKAIAQTGLLYSTDEYNRDRYTELDEISNHLLHDVTAAPLELIRNFYLEVKEYPTPKTDIRAVIFNEQGEILMVREQSDGKWSLPGGWADIGCTPSEVAIKEVREETGFIVKAFKLLAVLDKRNYPHPPEPEYVYKHFIQCYITGGALVSAYDIKEVAFFPQYALPDLSGNRIVRSQLDLMFEFLYNADKPTIFD